MADSVTLVFLIVVAVSLSWTHIILFNAHLQRAHHAVWVRLGEPSPSNLSTRSSLRMWRFMWLDHAKVDSLQLRVYVVSGQVLQVLIVALLFVLAVGDGRTEAS